MESINKYLEEFKKYESNLSFTIRAIFPAGKGYNINLENERYISYSLYNKLREANKTAEIYFRPNSHKFVLADLDNKTEKEIYSLLDNDLEFTPFNINCTSKNNYQAWFYIPEIKTADGYKRYAGILCHLFDADKGCVKSHQVGRLPYFTNNKVGRNKYKSKIDYKAKGKKTLKLSKKTEDYIKSQEKKGLLELGKKRLMDAVDEENKKVKKRDFVPLTDEEKKYYGGKSDPIPIPRKKVDTTESQYEDRADYGYFSGIVERDSSIQLSNFTRIYNARSKNTKNVGNSNYISKLYSAIKNNIN